MIINRINETNINYTNSVSKDIRKKIGQFFTPPTTASFMGNLMECAIPSIRILDAGAGSGILAGALCEKLLANQNVNDVYVDLYENNEDILPLLKENMQYIKGLMNKAGKDFNYRIIDKNFILDNADFWNNKETRSEEQLYDVIISNPPYKKIGKLNAESIAMDSVVYGQPNIYFLFMAMSVKLLKKGGQMIYITPRSFTSGAYFKKFRKYFFSNVVIKNLHIFHSRKDVFNCDEILQETVILRAVKATNTDTDILEISVSNDLTFQNVSSIRVNYNLVLDKKSDNLFFMIPSSQEEVDLISFISNWDYNLEKLGFKLKTGPVVDFRSIKYLKEEQKDNTVPLLWASNFENYNITFPITNDKKPQYILNNKNTEGLLLPNKNYLLIKRFTSKEENKRIQCALYFSGDFNYNKIGIENHLNYIVKEKEDISKEELYGLFAIFNSSFIDRYYRILDGSTQVNAMEMNNLPLPALNDIRRIGRQVIEHSNITVQYCDDIISSKFHKIEMAI